MSWRTNRFRDGCSPLATRGYADVELLPELTGGAADAAALSGDATIGVVDADAVRAAELDAGPGDAPVL